MICDKDLSFHNNSQEPAHIQTILIFPLSDKLRKVFKSSILRELRCWIIIIYLFAAHSHRSDKLI